MAGACAAVAGPDPYPDPCSASPFASALWAPLTGDGPLDAAVGTPSETLGVAGSMRSGVPTGEGVDALSAAGLPTSALPPSDLRDRPFGAPWSVLQLRICTAAAGS